MKSNNEKDSKASVEKKTVKNTLIDIQRIKLEKLMKNPVSTKMCFILIKQRMIRLNIDEAIRVRLLQLIGQLSLTVSLE